MLEVAAIMPVCKETEFNQGLRTCAGEPGPPGTYLTLLPSISTFSAPFRPNPFTKQTLTSARLDLTNRTLTACIHSQLELRLWLVKSAITAVAIFLSLYRSLQAWFVLVTSAYILFVVLRRAPFMNRNVNNLYAGLYATLLWVCVCLVPLLLFKKKLNASTVTTVS